MISVKLGGMERTREAFKRMRGRARDGTRVLRGPIDKSISAFWRRMFISNGLYGGERWAAHSPVTRLIRRKSRGRGRGGLLRDTNRLWAALTKGSGPGAYRRVTPHLIERGTTWPHAKFAQEGFKSVSWPAITWQSGRRTGSQIANVTWLERAHARKVKPRRLVPRRMPAVLLQTWDRLIARWITEGKLHDA